MEHCRIDDYKKAVEDCKLFNVGTLHYLMERRKLPEGLTLKWNQQMTKPIFIESSAVKEMEPEGIETVWIPVYPGLIAQKLVNENKGIYAPF